MFPPMVGYGEFGYHYKFRTCFFKANDDESWMYGTIFCCVLGVFPPVMASMFFYCKILLKLAKNRRNLMKHYLPPIAKVVSRLDLDDKPKSAQLLQSKKVEFKNVTPVRSVPTIKPKKKKSSTALLLRQNSHQKRSAMMLVTVFTVIVICWLPISVSFIADRHNKLPSIAYVMFVILAWCNSCVNIFIYAGMNLQFRRAYKELLTFRKDREATTLSGGLGSKGALESISESRT